MSLRDFDPKLPDIDLLVISEEPTLGYVFFPSEPVPKRIESWIMPVGEQRVRELVVEIGQMKKEVHMGQGNEKDVAEGTDCPPGECIIQSQIVPDYIMTSIAQKC